MIISILALVLSLRLQSYPNSASRREALRTKRIFPNLEYVESLASQKREEHRAWVGTVLPIEHPWWDTHMPPSAWNCKCSVRKTRRAVTPVPADGPDDETMPPVLRQNPGKTASPLRLSEHPYLKGQGLPTCPECRLQGLVSSAELSDEEGELCPMHRLAKEATWRRRAKAFLEYAKKMLIGKVSFSHPAFNGRKAVIVRNSITENTSYGDLQSLKMDVLRHIESYDLSACEYRLEENTKPEQKPNVVGYHVFTTKYQGRLKKWRGSTIEIKYEETKSMIKLHFIKKIESPGNPNRP